MLLRWWEISVISGVLLILGGFTSAYFQFRASLKYANFGSDIHWVARIPTADDALILSMPTGWIVLAGVAFVVAGFYFRSHYPATKAD